MAQAESETTFKKLPVTVLSGFLGSGKTTLLRHLLKADHGLRIAVIVNDMASVNIDGNRARMVESQPQLVEMQNGCICCTLREDLLIEIRKLALEQKFDYLLIESTGVSEPLPVAETFTFGALGPEAQDENGDGETEECPQGDAIAGEDQKSKHDHASGDCETGECTKENGAAAENQESNRDQDEKDCETGDCPEKDDKNSDEVMKVLADIADLDCMVTVMDAKQFFDYLNDDADIFEKWGSEEDIAEEDQGKGVSSLLIDQIEFANIILLNKTDLVSSDEMARVTSVVKKLNPVAKVLKTQYSKIAPKEVLGTGLFNFEEAQFHAGWLKEIRGEHTPESEEYGISSFIFRSRRPMSGIRFQEFVEGGILKEENVIRAKGNLWLDCAEKQVTDFDLAGASIEISSSNQWFIEMKNNEPETWEELNEEAKEAINKDFEGPNGDKRQEMVFIGKDMNEKKIRGLIEECLLTDAELSGPWTEAINPFEPPEDEPMQDSATEDEKPQEDETELSKKRKREDADEGPARKKSKTDAQKSQSERAKVQEKIYEFKNVPSEVKVSKTVVN